MTQESNTGDRHFSQTLRKVHYPHGNDNLRFMYILPDSSKISTLKSTLQTTKFLDLVFAQSRVSCCHDNRM